MRRKIYLIPVTLAILFFLLMSAPLQVSLAAPLLDQGRQIVVNSTDDSGPGSFRKALEEASTGDTITFDPETFPQDIPAVITLLTPLPPITQGSLTIDASDAGVILDGSRVGKDEPIAGLLIRSNGNKVRGMQIRSFSGGAIEINMGGNNIIGGASENERNIISGNLIGIILSGTGTKGSIIQGNYIGSDETGTQPDGNDECGIWIGNGASGNLIGGSNPGEGNLISGNLHSGVIVDNGWNNIISGNIIGLDASGSLPLGNGYMGIMLIWGSQGNQIGGAEAGEGNIISANVAAGVDLTNTGTNNNTISGNTIGTDISGTIPMGNGWAGISLNTNADNNIIGGIGTTASYDCSGECNLISGNEGDGIWIGTNGNSIMGNYIGTDVSGTVAIGNMMDGIYIEDGSHSNMVGPENLIAYNAADGIGIGSIDTGENTLTSNSIHDNNGSGILILEGGNANLEPPSITYFSTYFIRGTVKENAVVEIYSDREGEGQFFEGSTIADDKGLFTFRIPAEGFHGDNFTLVATDVDGNTSQFTQPVRFATPLITRALPGILSPVEISFETQVVATNIGLAVLSVLFFGFTSTLFNSILESYHLELVNMINRLVPERFRNRTNRKDKADPPPKKALGRLFWRWLLVILLTTIIESFLDPEVSIFGFEHAGTLITLFLSAAIVSAFELGSGVFARRRWAPALKTIGSVQWLGLLLAIGSVLFSRIMNFTPGYLYGILGAVVLLPEIENDAISGKKGLFVQLVIFLGGLIFWIATIFLPNSLVELEPIFLTIFLMTLQGVFFKLWPLSTTDGGDIWNWKKPVWVIFFSVVFYCFYHFVLNPDGSAVQAFQQNGVQTLLVLFAVFGLATFILWLLFPVRLRNKQSGGE